MAYVCTSINIIGQPIVHVLNICHSIQNTALHVVIKH